MTSSASTEMPSSFSACSPHEALQAAPRVGAMPCDRMNWATAVSYSLRDISNSLSMSCAIELRGGNDRQSSTHVESGFLLKENYVSQRPLNEHDLAENVVSQYKARTEESIGGRFKMGGNAAQKMKMLAIDVRAD
jgi:hypothetical protein